MIDMNMPLLAKSGSNLSHAPENTPCADLWAVILFILNVLIIAYMAFFSHNAINVIVTPQGKEIFIASGILSLTGALIGTAWLSFVLAYSSSIIYFMMWAAVVVNALATLSALFSGSIFGAVLFGVCTAASYHYITAVERRIQFASTVLGIATKSIKRNYTAILLCSYGVLVLAFAWVALWGAATFDRISSFTDTDKDNSYIEWSELFLSLLSLHWGCQLLKAVLIATVAGALASWWFEPQVTNPVFGTLLRVISSSLGPLCFGSLLVSVIQTTHDMLRMVKSGMQRDTEEQRRMGHREDNNNALAECAKYIIIFLIEQLLYIFEGLMNYFNKYAFCYVAAYGYGFIEAGSRVMKLFRDRGWMAVINDNLISNVLFLSMLACAIVNGLLGVILAIIAQSNGYTNLDSPFAIYGLLGGVTGALVGVMLSTAIDSSVCMVYICYAEGESALQKNHPEDLALLEAAWNECHPATARVTSGNMARAYYV